MWMNRVVECVGASNLVLKTLNRNSKGQQYYLDAQSQTIKSQQWKDRSITIQSNGNSNNLYMTTTSARWFQLFYFRDNKLVNEKGKVMEVYQGIDRENNNIVVGNSKDGSLN